MKSDINDLCEAFLAALTNAGYAVKSIENYKQVSNRFKKFCAENGYDTYTVNIGQIFADNVFNEETGAFVGYRNVMYGRFVRLINSFYLQGTFDCCPSSVQDTFSRGFYQRDALTDFFDEIQERCQFKYWFFGHYHENMVVEKRFVMLYEQIIRLK